jgi:hypothetical protein
MKTFILMGVFILAVLAAAMARGDEYEEVRPAGCDMDPEQAYRMGFRLIKLSIRETAARCNTESVAEVVVANHHQIIVDPSVPDQIRGLTSLEPAPLPACAWFIKKVLLGNGLAPIQESAHVVRIVPLSSVKPGQPLADMSW